MARVGRCTAAGAGHGRGWVLRGGGRAGEPRAGTGRGCSGGRRWACDVGGYVPVWEAAESGRMFCS
jgi:hypothetical protein